MQRRAFTLVEIMIVVGIIAFLAAIAIPNLLRSRLNANEASALSTLKTIVTSAITYRSSNAQYPQTLAILAADNPPYIDTVLGSGLKNGYNFYFTGAANAFTATARPVTYRGSGIRSFFVDESGFFRFTDQDAEPTIDDSAVQ